ncbi:NAD(P)-dependent oxidoreductase [Pusillimonas sp. SM2304]|uniref:NAD(P)-dependent oxidoreductase n=1 Tax=Pusillimonas sp. SM2304 TaxID=3073241 RepID=UPI0028761185|nr:NAD(P)-dependent oxidoreductase [Pusillimonas sp. SM2304]MDS1140071.1 NAD(P)-dependent oxidoreductase [Pusillimonas sp. SM2304]
MIEAGNYPTSPNAQPPADDKVVACIGLGLMGGAMAANLLKAGYAVQGFDLDPAAMTRLKQLGGAMAPHPAAAASGASIALIMVSHSKQVEQVLFGPQGVASALPAGGVVWVASTIPAANMQDFAQRLAAHGLLAVDGPVSGGMTGAEAGTLTVIAGGSDAALAAAHGAMQACSQTVHHVGGVGAASTIKVINNLLAASHVALTAEALALGMRAGVDPKQLVQVIMQSSGTSRMFEKRAARMVAEDHTPHASIGTFLKDLDIALDTAESLHCPTPIAIAARQVFKMGADAVMARASDTLLLKIYEQLEGVDTASNPGEAPCRHSNKN